MDTIVNIPFPPHYTDWIDILFQLEATRRCFPLLRYAQQKKDKFTNSKKKMENNLNTNCKWDRVKEEFSASDDVGANSTRRTMIRAGVRMFNLSFVYTDTVPT
jgi:hypothetical protein